MKVLPKIECFRNLIVPVGSTQVLGVFHNSEEMITIRVNEKYLEKHPKAAKDYQRCH